MKRGMRGLALAGGAAAMIFLCGDRYLLLAQPSSPAPSPLIALLVEELRRNFEPLREKAEPKAYYLAYAVTDQESWVIGGTGGALQASERQRNRWLDVTLRVGTPQLDNYRRSPTDRPQFTRGAALPLEADPLAIRRQLWLETDRVYRLAAQRYIRILSDQQLKAAPQDPSPDFSQEPPRQQMLPLSPVSLSRKELEEWEKRARRWSQRMDEFPDLLSSSVTIVVQNNNQFFVDSDGARIQHGRAFARILISAQARAMDGMDVAASHTFDAATPAGLPTGKVVEDTVARIGAQVTALRTAPLAEPFVGPAILSGHSAAVFFHEIFGHRIEGHRQKDETEGQTFTKMIGQAVLPDFLSVRFDPTQRQWEGQDLNGWYEFDDEGVRAQRVDVVEKGILKTFLLSRSPVAGFHHSNGHGRRQPGREVVSRQSNLIVESSRAVPEARLRQMLKEEIRRQEKPYGLYFQSVTGGFTTTARSALQAFTVIPLVVYRVYPDDRPDELIRGVDIVGTPLASFGKILATSDRAEVFNGYCGAESGQVPVAAVSPALLVSEIEVQRKPTTQQRPPFLPRPEVR